MVPWTVTLGLSCYILLTLGIGIYAGRQIKGAGDFIVAGRRLGLILATGTLAATWFGGGIVIGAASEAYKKGVFRRHCRPIRGGSLLDFGGPFLCAAYAPYGSHDHS
jgi:hypothetical protein